MLFDFHKTQNAKQSQSVHATYVVSGLRRQAVEAPAKDGDDTVMNSSPFPSSYKMSSAPQETPETVIRSISFAREEELKGSAALCCEANGSDTAAALKAQYEEITSMHIYSLESTSPQVILPRSSSRPRLTLQGHQCDHPRQ